MNADAEDPEPSGGAERQKNSVMVSGDPEELEAYGLVAQGFEASRSDVTVDLIKIDQFTGQDESATGRVDRRR